jgi:hypothetical protein
MAVQPAAVLRGPADAAPEPALLAPALLQAAGQSPSVLGALRWLRGSAGAARAV